MKTTPSLLSESMLVLRDEDNTVIVDIVLLLRTVCAFIASPLLLRTVAGVDSFVLIKCYRHHFYLSHHQPIKYPPHNTTITYVTAFRALDHYHHLNLHVMLTCPCPFHFPTMYSNSAISTLAFIGRSNPCNASCPSGLACLCAKQCSGRSLAGPTCHGHPPLLVLVGSVVRTRHRGGALE